MFLLLDIIVIIGIIGIYITQLALHYVYLLKCNFSYQMYNFSFSLPIRIVKIIFPQKKNKK